MKKILLVNWTQRHNNAGGVESRMQSLHEMFPGSELISVTDLMGGKIGNYIKAAVKITEYLEKRFKEDNNILVIRDASCGINSNIPQVTIWAEPFYVLGEFFNNDFYKEMSILRLGAKNNTLKVTIGDLLINDIKYIGVIPDAVIPEAVDINFWRPLNNKEKLREKYEIPKDKIVGIWVGANGIVKNSDMFDKITNTITNIYWLKITKAMNYSKEEMLELYNCADFFILTSTIEGGCLSWLEAMACNLPCIVSKTGYFWNYWNERVGIRIDCDNYEQHLNAVKNIMKIKTDSRQTLIDMKLDYETWKLRWTTLVNDSIKIFNDYKQTLSKEQNKK